MSRRLARIAAVVVTVGALCGAVALLWPSSISERVYRYGIAHGRTDAKNPTRHLEDVRDDQTALAYLSVPLVKNGKPDDESLEVIKTVFNAPINDQRAYVEAFARGYRDGYSSSSK